MGKVREDEKSVGVVEKCWVMCGKVFWGVREEMWGSVEERCGKVWGR